METNLLVHEVDMLITDICGQELIQTSRVIDRLLDMRLLLTSEIALVDGVAS